MRGSTSDEKLFMTRNGLKKPAIVFLIRAMPTWITKYNRIEKVREEANGLTCMICTVMSFKAARVLGVTRSVGAE